MLEWYDIIENIEKQLQKLKLLAECAKIDLDEVFNSDIGMRKATKKLENIILENHTNHIFYSQYSNITVNRKPHKIRLPNLLNHCG